METAARVIDRGSDYQVTASLATIARLLEVTDQQDGVPPDVRHCLDQVAAEVRELSDACGRLLRQDCGCDSTPSTGNGSTFSAERIRDGLIGDPATLRTTVDRSARVAEGVLAPVNVQPRKREPDIAGLTGQEQRILRLIAEGCTNRQIANELFLAEKTVKNYVSNLLRKLGMERRTQAAVFAARHGRLSMAVPAPASVA